MAKTDSQKTWQKIAFDELHENHPDSCHHVTY